MLQVNHDGSTYEECPDAFRSVNNVLSASALAEISEFRVCDGRDYELIPELMFENGKLSEAG